MARFVTSESPPAPSRKASSPRRPGEPGKRPRRPVKNVQRLRYSSSVVAPSTPLGSTLCRVQAKRCFSETVFFQPLRIFNVVPFHSASPLRHRRAGVGGKRNSPRRVTPAKRDRTDSGVTSRHGFNDSMPLEPLHCGAFEFTIGVAFLHVLALVVLDFALAHGQRDFHTPVFPVEGERQE